MNAPNWIQLVAARIWHTLIGAGMPQEKAKAVLDGEMEKIIAEHESFGAQPEEKAKAAPEDEDPITSRGEKLSALRAETHRWGGWEPWN